MDRASLAVAERAGGDVYRAQNEKQDGKLSESKNFVNFAYLKCMSHEQTLKSDFTNTDFL